MLIKTVDGNEACAHTSYLFSDIAGIYPITPSSPMAEHIDEWSSKNIKNVFDMPVKVIEMQSEAGAIAFVHGALSNGNYATTFTSSQGLLLMIPNMYKIAGEMLPCVINVAARSLSTHALSIQGDHQDIYAARSTGFNMLSSSSVRDVTFMTAISYLTAMECNLPFINFFDGFRTSHELSKVELLTKEDIIDIIPFDSVKSFRDKSLSISDYAKGTAMMENEYFLVTEARNSDYDKVPDTVNKYMNMFNKKFNKDFHPFTYYGSDKASKVIVAMGSVCDTIKEVIDENPDFGLITCHLYRPFSEKYFFDVLPKGVKTIAVLDRTKEFGSVGEPLYTDIVGIFNGKKSPKIIGGRYGLSSKNVTPSDIMSVYNYMDNGTTNFTVGIVDDVTNLSIPKCKFIPDTIHKELLIWGYGSDGMVSASKDILKIIGDNTDHYVQGYFQYDSKKSGGVTRCHIRLSEDLIRSTYYVENPSLVVCTKENYILKYDMLSNIRKNGTFIYVTNSNEKEVDDLLSSDIKKTIIDKNIKFYIIDAYSLAEKCGLKNKISTILETCILDNLGYGKYIDNIKSSIKERFKKKGEDVINSNLSAIDDALKYLKEIKVCFNDIEFIDNEDVILDKVFNDSIKLKGELKVSDFISIKDGKYRLSTSKYEKRDIAEKIPVWNKDKCIQCNQCAFVCPHAVIRPYLLDDEEVKSSPKGMKIRLRNAIGSKYQYMIYVNKEDCTGCSICAKVCPSNALTMTKKDSVRKNSYLDFLETVTEKSSEINNTVKGTQFKKPLFEYSGACAGCGETPYLKLLTQLFGDRITISNATGCSSIYSSSFPSIPYNVPWASSLFEDNAEYGYGIMMGYNNNRLKVKEIFEKEVDGVNKSLINKWLLNIDDVKVCDEVYNNFDYSKSEVGDLKEFIKKKSTWIIGGDGWAYDIGFSGIDHALSSGQNIRILVLDTEVYSNTGGQSSKSSNRSSIAKFTSNGKETCKKDLARIAMCYKGVYVAQISMANMNAVIKAFNEAEKHDGPSIIIAYSPCINHGIKNGMEDGINEQKLAVASGYFPIFRYDGNTGEFNLDSKMPDFSKLDEFIDNETRFKALKIVNEEKAEELFEMLKKDVKDRYDYYLSLKNNS